MRVIHEQVPPAARIFDPLQAAGHRRHPRQRARHHGGLHPESAAHGHRRQRVGHVEPPRQRQLHRTLSPRRDRPKDGLPFGAAHVLRAHGGRGIESVAHHPPGQKRLPRQPPPVGVIQIHDGRGRRGRRGQRLEQPLLGQKIVLHGAVEIQMVHAQVREHGGAEIRAAQALRRQPLRRHLHRHGLVAGLPAFGQHLLEIGGFRRGPGGGDPAAAVFVIHRADQAGRQAGFAQNVPHHERRGGLAVGPGDPDDPQRTRWLAVEPGRDVAHGRAGVLRADRRQTAQPVQRPFVQDRHRAAPHCLLDMQPAIGGLPRQRKKQRARPYPPRIVGQRRHDRPAARHRLHPFDSLQQPGQFPFARRRRRGLRLHRVPSPARPAAPSAFSSGLRSR